MFRATPATIEYLRTEGYDLWTISLWEDWLTRQPQLDQAIDELRAAFDGVTLGSGVGLREAEAIDNYADAETRAAERQRDEKQRWQDIDVALLNTCHAAPCYFDPEGFKFHLPAFLIADLNDQFDMGYGFVARLIEKSPSSTEWIDLLSVAQRQAITSILDIVQHHPEYYGQSEAFHRAINRLADQAK